NHVERFVIDEGHTAERRTHDYGYDLCLTTYDEQGYVEPGSIYVQLKASDKLEDTGVDYVFDLDMRDYHLWKRESMPVVLILFDATRRRAYWVYVQRFFAEDASRLPKKGPETVRIRVSKGQVVSRRAVRRLRAHKQAVLAQMTGQVKHV